MGLSLAFSKKTENLAAAVAVHRGYRRPHPPVASWSIGLKL